ncbi:MAG: threonine-phosphate decarboxylase [Bacilli bacterium]
MAGLDGSIGSWLVTNAGMDKVGVNQLEHGGRIDDYSAQTGKEAGDILDCSANIHPLGPPASVMEAIERSLSGIRHYPDPRHRQVKKALAQRFQVEPESVLCGNGATECMELLVRWLRPSRCVILDPAFGEYEAIARRCDRPILRLSLFDGSRFALPLSALDQALCPGDLLFLNHPHNPSGSSWPVAGWLPFAQAWAQAGVHVLIDESFADFLPQADAQSALRRAARSPNLYVVRSATKMFAIPGLRFGFAVGTPRVLGELEEQRDPWSVNHLAQRAAAAAYLDGSFAELTADWLSRAQARQKETWAAHPAWTVFPTSVNFFLVRFASREQSLQVQDGLRREAIFLRSCGNFAGLSDAYARIALRTEDENERVWSAVTRIASTGDVCRE